MIGRTGTLDREGDTNVITFERSFGASPDRVWEALTTADGLTSWLAVSATVAAGEGGAIEIEFDDGQKVDGTITSWEPTSRFAHTWVINGDVSTDLEYRLEPDGTGTKLTLSHRGLPDEMCSGYTPGWHAFLVRLGAVTDGDPAPDWLPLFQEAAPLYT